MNIQGEKKNLVNLFHTLSCKYLGESMTCTPRDQDCMNSSSFSFSYPTCVPRVDEHDTIAARARRCARRFDAAQCTKTGRKLEHGLITSCVCEPAMMCGLRMQLGRGGPVRRRQRVLGVYSSFAVSAWVCGPGVCVCSEVGVAHHNEAVSRVR